MAEAQDNSEMGYSLLTPWKRKGKERRKKVVTTRGIWSPIQVPTTLTERELTLFSGRNMLLSLWYSDSTLNAIFFSRWEKVSKRGKNLWYYDWESRGQKIRGIWKWEQLLDLTCFGDRTRGTFLIIASVSRTKITRSHGPITLWMWMFWTVLHLLVYIYSITAAFYTIS